MSVQDKLKLQIQALQMNVNAEQQDIQEAQMGWQLAQQIGDKQTWLYQKGKEQQHRLEVQKLQGKLKAAQDQMRLHETAQGNLQHALIIQEGAAELKQATEAMDTLNLEDHIDSIQDAAGQIEQHDALLTTSFIPATAAELELQDQLGDEWDSIQAHRVAAGMPEIQPTTTTTETPTVTAAAAAATTKMDAKSTMI